MGSTFTIIAFAIWPDFPKTQSLNHVMSGRLCFSTFPPPPPNLKALMVESSVLVPLLWWQHQLRSCDHHRVTWIARYAALKPLGRCHLPSYLGMPFLSWSVFEGWIVSLVNSCILECKIGRWIEYWRWWYCKFTHMEEAIECCSAEDVWVSTVLGPYLLDLVEDGRSDREMQWCYRCGWLLWFCPSNSVMSLSFCIVKCWGQGSLMLLVCGVMLRGRLYSACWWALVCKAGYSKEWLV